MFVRLTQILILLATVVAAQTFDSGSDGTDGAFVLQPDMGTVIFDPATTLGRPVDPDRDNVYHFTTIDVPAGTTVKLTQTILGGPVTWLASGPVNIVGTIDLNGDKGVDGNSIGLRLPSIPGAGGFHGGPGGSTTVRPASPGLGPAGGLAGTSASSVWGKGGSNTANRFLVPLVGGSGGGGGVGVTGNQMGGSGGAGGGAILIASSDSITVATTGFINARGGQGGISNGNSVYGGGGAGGSIRVVAPRIQGNGTLAVNGGLNQISGNNGGGSGIIRIEAFVHGYSFSLSTTPFVSTPFDTFVTTLGLPTIRVVSVGGVPVTANPTGSFDVPDVTIDSAAGVPVVVEAQRIPLDAEMKLTVFPEDGPDISVDVPNRTGVLDLSTATVSVQFPTGFSRGFLRATFSAQP